MSLDESAAEFRPLEPVPEIPRQEKEKAVELALASRTLARSEQLRSFLKYVCDMAMSGRADQISEQLIGVRALGRSRDFSPGEDSSVRNRARSLRLKLEEFYREERPDLEIRIEIPVGSYCPTFHRAPPPEPVRSLSTEQPAPVRWFRTAGRSAVAAFALGVLVTAMSGWLVLNRVPHKPAHDPALADFWGPLLQPETDVIISVATPPQLFVRSFPKEAPPRRKLLSPPQEVYSWYASGGKISGAIELGVLPTHNSPLWGDAAGAAIIGGILSRAGAAVQVRPERILPFPAFRARNAVVLGTPEYSPAAKRFLERGNFTIEYSNEAGDWVIVNRKPAGGEPPYYAPRRDSEQQIADVYALITVLPSDGPPQDRHRTIVVSGLNSAGTQAAAEYITSAAYLAQLKQQFRTDRQRSNPSSFQVVIKSTSDSTLPLNVSHVTYRILAP